MANTKALDRYAQVAYIGLACSAPNTLTYKKLDIITGALLGAKQYGLLIERAEVYYGSTTLQDLDSDGDRVQFALTVSDSSSTLDVSRPEVLFNTEILRVDAGTAASTWMFDRPIVRDFSGVTGGGILVPADRIYGGLHSVGMTIAAVVSCRLWYTVVELDTGSYLELLQSRSMLSTN